MHQEVDEPGHGVDREQRQAHHQVADLADDVEREQPAHLVLGHRADDADDHGQGRHRQQQRLEVGRLFGEEQREDAHEGIDADLREQAAEERGDCHRGRVIRSRQPEEERHQRGLDAEGDEQHGREARGQPGIHVAHAQREVGHVDRAGDPVDDADGHQQDGRGHQVDGHVLERALELRPLPTQRQQHERGDEQDLEPDVEVEEVTGQEGAGHARQQHHRQRVVGETLAAPVDGGRGVEHDGHRQHTGEHDEDGAEEVGHHGDAEGCRPAADLQHLVAVALDHDEQHDPDRQQHGRAGQGDRPLGCRGAPGHEAQGRSDERHQQRQHDHGAHWMSASLRSSTSSEPPSW